MDKRIIVLDLETQRMMRDVRPYAWLGFSDKFITLKLRRMERKFGARVPSEIPRKFSPWLSLLPQPVTNFKALYKFINDPRTQKADQFHLIGYDPRRCEIDLNLHEANPNQVGSPFFNRRLGLALAITWDKKNGFREWWENQAVDLVNELSRYRAIIGANLINFDYCVLERYVPDVRKRLGFRTIDILAHARWGLFLTFIHSRLRGKKLSKIRVERIFKRNRSFPFNSDNYFFRKHGSNPEVWDMGPGEWLMNIWGFKVSLASLSKGTLNQAKLGKAADAPTLFARGKYQELVSYCQQDVALTRDIFFAGCNDGAVSTPHATVPIRWKELVEKHLVTLRRKEGPIHERQCLKFQHDLLSDEPAFFPLEKLFR